MPLKSKGSDAIDSCLEGQALFSVRREESMKFTVRDAIDGNTIIIKPSWTKGGIGRTVDITNDAQRQWLDNVTRLVRPGHSLIPHDRSSKHHLNHYESQAKLMEVCKLHGLRHAYAQRRYKELTRLLEPSGQGFNCPIDGGKPYRSMSITEKMIDRQARQILSRQLGHSHVSITRIYLG